MKAQNIIAAKRDGQELADSDIRQFVAGYTSGEIADSQMSAFLMAAYIRGLSFDETTSLTLAMIESGKVLDLSSIAATKVDKHSTGGIGDKTTLALVPMLAACGFIVPKMSGRGLGFTGGTVDKLESIPGFNTTLSLERFVKQLAEIGAAIAGQSSEITPADKMIYALRDVTATVDSIPLIAASIMSKKIACSGEVILLDVKVGSGAFMKTIERARELSNTMVAIGTNLNRRVGALITDMSQPLGRAIGNALEMSEAIETLRGRGPADLTDLCVELCAVLINLAEPDCNMTQAIDRARESLDSGAASAKFAEIVEAQGGDIRALDDPSLLPQANIVHSVCSRCAGVVSRIDAAGIGEAASALGAGRQRKEDGIDPAVGVLIEKKIGDTVKSGDVLAIIHGNDPAAVDCADKIIQRCYTIGAEANIPPLIVERI